MSNKNQIKVTCNCEGEIDPDCYWTSKVSRRLCSSDEEYEREIKACKEACKQELLESIEDYHSRTGRYHEDFERLH